MKIPTSKLYKKQNDRLIPVMRKKALIVGYNIGINFSASNVVDIVFVDNLQTKIKGVPASSATLQGIIGANNAGLYTNIRCVVDIFGEANVSQMIVAYTY